MKLTETEFSCRTPKLHNFEILSLAGFYGDLGPPIISQEVGGEDHVRERRSTSPPGKQSVERLVVGLVRARNPGSGQQELEKYSDHFLAPLT